MCEHANHSKNRTLRILTARECVCVCVYVNLLALGEGVLVDGLDDIFEEDLGGEGVAVVHDGLSVLTVPAVHCGQETQTT